MKKFLIDSYKSVSGNLERLFGGLKYPKDELIVLCMHSTPADRISDFGSLVDFLLEHFRAMDPQQLDAYFKGEMNEGPYVLFTFDDGLRNNLHAADMLEQKGVKAFFFLVPDFMNAQDPKAYYLKNIRPVIDPSFDKQPEDFTPLGFEHARNLKAKGHAIGSHTKSHLLRAGMSEEQQQDEIVSGARILEKELERVDSFCSPINTLISVDATGKKLIESNYKYHFTTFPGLNGPSKNPLMICRRNIEVGWSKGKISFAIGKWDLPRWQSGISRFQSL